MAYSVAQLASLYAAANGLSVSSSHVLIMAAIGMAESGGNPVAHNPSGASGLWQIMPSHIHDSGWSFGSNFYDPTTNARMAEFIYKEQGYSAWTTFTSGAYKEHLSMTQPADLSIPIPGLPPGIGPSLNIGSLLGISKDLFSAGFWRRVGIGLIGVLLLLVGLAILLRQPLQEATGDVASVAKGAALA